MTTDQTKGVAGGVESARVQWERGSWGLGWEVKGEKRAHWTGEFTSPATFCHFGRAGTLLWGDPERDLALAVFRESLCLAHVDLHTYPLGASQ
jgi:beta-lactamase class C